MLLAPLTPFTQDSKHLVLNAGMVLFVDMKRINQGVVL
ncbi:MAG: hypothetical protein ACJAWI_001366 [Marinomonas primoryensis]|jgi:hypothetical protein